eukprot:CAMPEP_0115066878 /NCGR_PEP_ID=MMETSP0227-20121206/11063_1 /TAXON_ID=89957 /ORGANISM="Polarella glacialis, Strain CCMP 1383" /LENGTH=303 /DNA_ID=CAMNT_0002452851 /DNA_START=18 /DNA_END=929 /DNA_ORIENTATION=+
MAGNDMTWLSGDVRRKGPRIFKDNQEKLLVELGEEVGRTPAVFEQAQKNREANQKRLNEMLEETLRQIKKARAHKAQKAKHVMDTTKSYTAKFEHELMGSREALRRDMSEAFGLMTTSMEDLEQQMTDAEEALRQQTEHRKQHIEATLGPIRDEAQRLTLALAAESKSRRLQDEAREKLLADEIEAITGQIDTEKFHREQQIMTFERWADAEQQQIAKRQYHLEKSVRDTVRDIRAEHHDQVKARIDNQAGIMESIASFVHKYRYQVDKDIALQRSAGSLHDAQMMSHTQGFADGTQFQPAGP